MKRVVAILCVLACLCSLCLPVLAAEETVTVKAYVAAGWTDVYLYVWDDDGPNAEWPGEKMNADGDGWYSLEIIGKYPNAIVNNGEGAQTQDMEIMVGIDQWITVDGSGHGESFYEEPTGDQLPGGDNSGTAAPIDPNAEMVTVKAYLASDWADAYLYVWSDDGFFVEWPGSKMNADGDGWYSLEVPGTMTYAIVNDGNGLQTQDMEIMAGIDQWITVDVSGYGQAFYEEPTADQLPSNEPVAPPTDVPNVTIRAYVPESWTDVYLYVWIDSSTNYAAWPGTKMNADGDGWYSLEVPGAYPYAIVNNGTSGMDGGAQTQDMEIKTGVDLWITVDSLNAGTVFESQPTEDQLPSNEPVEETEAPTQAPSNDKEENKNDAGDNSANESKKNEPKDYTVLIIVVFCVVAVAAIGGALLIRNKRS